MNPNGEFCRDCHFSICQCDSNPFRLDDVPVQLPKENSMVITIVKLKTGFAIDCRGKELVRLINQKSLFAHLSKKFGFDKEAIHSIQSALYMDNKIDINLDHVGAA